MEIAYNGRFLAKEEPGGALKVSQRILEGVLELDRDNSYCVLTPEVRREIPVLSRSNVSVMTTGKWLYKRLPVGVSQVLWEQVTVPFILRRLLPDLYFTSMNGTVLSGKTPTVVTVHDLGYENREWFSGSFARWYSFIVPKVIKRAGKIVAVSEFTKDEILSKFEISPDKVKVIYNGVDEVFLEGEGGDCNAKRSNTLSLSEPYVGFVGSINPRKNPERTIKGFLRAKEKYSLPHKLLVAGGEKDIFAGSIDSEDPSVVFLGYLNEGELKELYTSADLTLFPSLYEGFGLPPLESMACGTPVVTSDRSAIPEVVGDAAVTVDPTDVEAIADGIGHVLTRDELRSELIEKGLDRAREFTWNKAARETLNLYDEFR